MFQFPDTVRVVRLLSPTRSFSATESAARPPRVGDTGTVVATLPAGEGFEVESVDENGATRWLATFTAEELELIHRPKNRG